MKRRKDEPLTDEQREARMQKMRETKDANRQKVIQAIVPYLPRLRRRWSDVAANGETTVECAVCKGVGIACCYACPVFGDAVFGFGRGRHCEDFMPLSPACIDVTPKVVRLTVSDPDHRPKSKSVKKQDAEDVTTLTPRERAQEYGRKILALLDEAEAEWRKGEVEGTQATELPSGRR